MREFFPAARGSLEGRFTQPMAHLIAQLCNNSRVCSTERSWRRLRRARCRGGCRPSGRRRRRRRPERSTQPVQRGPKESDQVLIAAKRIMLHGYCDIGYCDKSLFVTILERSYQVRNGSTLHQSPSDNLLLGHFCHCQGCRRKFADNVTISCKHCIYLLIHTHTLYCTSPKSCENCSQVLDPARILMETERGLMCAAAASSMENS